MPTRGRTEYFAAFYLWVNAASLLMLTFGASRLIRRYGIAFALLSLPVAVTLGTATLALNTILILMYVVRVVESALHSSLYDPGLDRVYLGMDDERARLVRPVLSGLLARVGEGAGAILVLALAFGAGISLRAMIGVFLGVLLVWMTTVLSLRGALNGEAQPAPVA